jgi:hypothetical protein
MPQSMRQDANEPDVIPGHVFPVLEDARQSLAAFNEALEKLGDPPAGT